MIQVGVSACIWRQTRAAVRVPEKVLLIKRSPNGPLPGLWSLPGGKLQFQETLQQAVRREVLEETGIPISLVDELTPITALDFVSPARQFAIVTYAAFLESDADADRVRATSDAAEAEWFSVQQLPSQDQCTPRLHSVVQTGFDWTVWRIEKQNKTSV